MERNSARQHPAQVPGSDNSAEMEELVSALEAELDDEVASMEPIDLATGRPHRAPEADKPAYDPWDDEALDQFLDDFDLQDADPLMAEAVEPPPEVEEAPHARGRLWMMAAAAGAVVVLVGGGTYWMMSGTGGFSSPPFVKAPEGPYKVLPDPDAKPVTTTVEGKAIYDSVDGIPPKGEERLVSRPDQGTELPPVTPQVSRVTLPDGHEVESDLPAGVEPLDSGPRRVRTVLVRPDGTLIENPPSAPGASLAMPETAPAEDGPGQIIAQDEDGGSSGDLPPLSPSEQTTPADSAKPASLASAAPVSVSAPTSSSQDAAVPVSPAADAATAAPAASAPLPPARPQRPATTPTTRTDGPLDLMAAASSKPASAQPPAVQPSAAQAKPAAPAVAPAASSDTGAGAYVQLSSQRSEEAAKATFASLQKRYPTVLGNLQPDIQKADLGSKGVYYRVRVGQPTRDKAATLCEALRAAGGQCLLAK